jgi:DNA-binding IclR family transcriptional regulator
MSNVNDTQDTVKTTETAFGILEHLLAADGARLTELASELGIAKSTAHRHLQTLYRREYVVREGDEFYVSLRFLEFGEQARGRKDAFSIIKGKVEELATETEERVQFIVEEHGRGVYVHRATGENAVQTDPGIGKRIALHSIAAGKAILAHLPDERVHEIVDRHGLEAVTDNTISDADVLFDDLEAIRDRGYATNNQENVKGLRAIGVPIRERDGGVIGAISVSGPTNRIKGPRLSEELPDLLLGTANELELNIAYS